jgi:pectinesterase
VVIAFGGAWVMRSKEDWSANAEKLAEAGYVVFNLNYRLMKPDGTNPWPDQFDDVQRAVRWVRANAELYGVDPERVGAVGHSSGGQMVGLLATRETRDNSDSALAAYASRVDAVVSLAGDMDLMIPFPNAFDNDLATQFFGGTRDEAPEVYRDASPITWVDEETVPFLILQGAAGDPAVEHSRLMTDALHEAGVEVVYGEFPRTDHLGIIAWELMGPETLAFLGRHLHPER